MLAGEAAPDADAPRLAGSGAPDDPFVGLLLRLSVPGTDAHGGPVDEPTYGDALVD